MCLLHILILCSMLFSCQQNFCLRSVFPTKTHCVHPWKLYTPNLRYNVKHFFIKMSRTIMYVVELCTWIILNVSTMFKPGEIHNLVQGNDAFHDAPVIITSRKTWDYKSESDGGSQWTWWNTIYKTSRHPWTFHLETHWAETTSRANILNILNDPCSCANSRVC